MSLKQEIETWVRAANFYENNEFDEALSSFEEIADTSKIHFNCGVIHATLGEHERAVQCYVEAIKLDRYLAVAYFQQGVSNFLMGDFEEAKANFNEAMENLRGNRYIDYNQLGLKFKLYSCEALFNRGLCDIYLRNTESGLKDLQNATNEKAVPDHDVIDEAIRDQADGYTVFSIPVGVIFRPNEAKVKNLRVKDYLGKAKLVAAVDRSNVFTGFTGAEIKKMNLPEAAIDDRPAALISYAATHLVKTDLKSRYRQQSEPPPPNRQVFPPTPPPEKDRLSGSSSGTVPTSNATTAINSNTTSMTSISSSAASKLAANKPARLDLSVAGFDRPKPPSPSASSVLSRTASERSPRAAMARIRAQSERPGPRALLPDALSRMNSERSRIGSTASTRTAFSEARSPQSNFGQPNELYEDVYDMYNSRGRQQRAAAGGSRSQHFAGPPSTQGYISEEDEDLTTSSQGGYDEPDFEMMVARSATGRSSRKSRSSNNGSMIMPVVPEQQQFDAPAPDVKRIRVKVHAEDSRYVIVTPSVQFADFVGSIRNKFGIMQSFKVKMKDDGDMITMSDQDDLEMAVEMAKDAARQTRSEMAKMEVWIEMV